MRLRRYNQRLRYPRLVCQHLISRVVQKRLLLDQEAMGKMRHMMRSQAAFCGLEVLTYCFLANHFHLFVRVDPKRMKPRDDAELLERFRALYGTKRCASLGIDAERLAAVLKLDGAAAAELRHRLIARMGDVSVFMRELKTRFTLWYNRTHGTVGTFWAERFRSVLVEAGSRAEKLVATYIDLNPLRAGVASDLEAWEYSGFGEACAGGAAARRGIARLEGAGEWTTAVRDRYRARMRGQLPTGRSAGATTEDTIGTTETRPRRIVAVSKALILGSREWVEEGCGANGWIGYRRGRRSRTVTDADSANGEVAAAGRRS